jgi:hypothetical protein
MIIHGAEQGSLAWFEARTGVVTSSRFGDVQAVKPEAWRVVRPSGTSVKLFNNPRDALDLVKEKAKLNYSIEKVPEKSLLAREDYMLELASEIVTGVLDDDADFETFWMRRGHELEPKARLWYEFITGVEVQQAGLIYSDETRRVGASVDGLIGDEGNAEIKCLKRFNHLRAILEEEIPERFIAQIQGQMWVTGRAWCDFISFHPSGHVVGWFARVVRDPEYMRLLDAAVPRFVEDLDALVEIMRGHL